MRVIGILCLVLAVLVTTGCAERRSPVETSVHTPGWNDPGSSDFHGVRVRAAGPDGCRSCHGADLGGAPGEVGCNDCHDGSGGHPDGFARPAAPTFHGLEVAAMGPRFCRDCHGADYSGGWSGVACADCHPGGPGGHPAPWSGHPADWLNPGSPRYHGAVVFEGGVDECTRCHGFGLGGGTSGVACAKCHTVTPEPKR